MTRCRPILTILLCLFFIKGLSQFSIATDGSILRNLNEQQKFWAFGQTVQLNFYASPKESIYAWIAYYSNGKFQNSFTATAKDQTTNPQQLYYTTHTSLRYRHVSVGWKHYFVGNYDSEGIWNVYGYAGFGLLLGNAENQNSNPVDTTLYSTTSPLEGSEAFRRLTLDLGLGTEMPIGTSVFLYTELRSLMPTSHYPSPYLYKNSYHLPTTVAVNLGIRLVIE